MIDNEVTDLWLCKKPHCPVPYTRAPYDKSGWFEINGINRHDGPVGNNIEAFEWGNPKEQEKAWKKIYATFKRLCGMYGFHITEDDDYYIASR